MGEKVELCYVLMPYGTKGEYLRDKSEADFIYYNIIIPAVDKFNNVKQRNLKVDRSVQNRTTGQIPRRILEDIARADICIVDITGSNPNVFFELGIRYSLRNKATILLRQDTQGNKELKIPFDIQGFRCLTYNPFSSEAVDELYEYLVSSQETHPRTDSLVYETFRDMEVYIPGYHSCQGDACEHVSWWEWWEQINKQAEILRNFNLHKSNSTNVHKPDIHVVIGITNGGLIFADLLGRLVFQNIPILSLWANRHSSPKCEQSAEKSCHYFENNFNKGVLNSIKEMFLNDASEDNKIGILLVDDLVRTSNTCLQAIEFLKKELNEYENKFEIIFAPLYCRRSMEKPEDQIKDMLICKYTGESLEEYLQTLRPLNRKFPYGKDLD